MTRDDVALEYLKQHALDFIAGYRSADELDRVAWCDPERFIDTQDPRVKELWGACLLKVFVDDGYADEDWLRQQVDAALDEVEAMERERWRAA